MTTWLPYQGYQLRFVTKNPLIFISIKNKISMDNIDISSLSADELVALIEACMAKRAELPPEFPKKPPDTVTAIVDPQWYCANIQDGSLLSIKHPGIGWLSYLIPPNERANLLTVLLRQALDPALNPTKHGGVAA